MSGKRFQARGKTVQKMGRDGLVERNLATGEEQRVSRRAEDISFGPERPLAQTGAPSPPKRRRQPRPALDGGSPAPQDTANAPERPGAVSPPDAAAQANPAVGSDLPHCVPSVEVPPPERPGCTGENGNTPQEPPRRQNGRRREPSPTACRNNRQKPPPNFPEIQSGVKRRRTAAHAPAGPVPPGPADTSMNSTPPDCAAEERPPGGRLRFEPEQTTPAAQHTPAKAARQQRRYEQAERRASQSAQRLEKAQSRIPVQRRVRLERQYDSAAGKVRRRLRFEQEPRQAAPVPTLLNRAGRAVQAAAVEKLHGKIREVERQNTAVEAAHRGELLAEQGGGRLLHWQKNRRRAAPFRALRHAERQAADASWNLAWQTALREHPDLQRKRVFAKWLHKQKLKRRYAQAAREAQTRARQAGRASTAAGKAVQAAAEFLSSHKTALLAAALAAAAVLCLVAGMASCAAMLPGVQAPLLSAVYPADEADICNADLYYSELETDLQLDIAQTESNHPGFDEYRYRIGEIGHNPYELMGYLSAAFGAFTLEQVRPELDQLFGEQYALTREAVAETRYDSEGNPYDWRVLETTLTVRPLGDIIAGRLPSGEGADRYEVYLQTLGGRQAYGNPFDFPWLACVSSGYGWRIHPVTGEKNLHRGVDIAAAQGTPIRAVQDGRVVSAGEAGSYGLCVVIEDEKGYQSRYAHCASLNVSAGQEVKRGDVIAAVGSTGQSTGPHLHLEVMHGGAYLNPYYFVDTGDGGTGGGAIPGVPGGPAIPDYPGEPVTDETYAAMLAEAQKYLGFPYVWGGSSPSTSFDCSGFVSWVVNHSGWSVGRLGAQALFNLCTPVSRENARPGDLIFFTKTFSCNTPVSHVGIYVGNGQMIHCGDVRPDRTEVEVEERRTEKGPTP